MIDLKIVAMVVLSFGAVILAVYGRLIWKCFAHLSERNKHPCTDDIVFKDVCESEKRRMEECIKGVVKLQAMQYENLEKKLEHLEDLIVNGSG
jgi:hypothetical protein